MTTPSQDDYLTRLRATMKPLSETRPNFRQLIYGASGVGKTVAGLQILQAITPPDKQILYIDTAEGWVSLENHSDLKKRVVRMEYKNLSQLEALTLAIKDGQFPEIGAIMLDEASSSADTTLDTVVTMRAELDKSKDPDTPTQPDYNTATVRVRKAFHPLITIPGVHVILISHVRSDKDNRNLEKLAPSFLPKLGAKIKQPLHMIAYLSGTQLEDESYARVFQVHPTRNVDAKTRVGGLKPQVYADELIARIQEWLKGAPEEAAPEEPVREIIIDDTEGVEVGES